MPKNKKERNENNVRIFYVCYIIRRNRATDDAVWQEFLHSHRFLMTH